MFQHFEVKYISIFWVNTWFLSLLLFFVHKFEIFSSYKLPKDSPPLVDMDWLASDLPIVTHSNGAILVMTMDLKSSSPAMAQLDLDGMFLCFKPVYAPSSYCSSYIKVNKLFCLWLSWLTGFRFVIKVLCGALTLWSQKQVSFLSPFCSTHWEGTSTHLQTLQTCKISISN